MRRFDVVVVGAGPAGSAAALTARSAGSSVLLIDRARFPRDKVCGACLSAGALDVLGALGLPGLARDLGGRRLDTLRVDAPERSARVRLPGSMAISRAALDEALVHAAVSRGVEFRPDSRAEPGDVVAEGREVLVRGPDGPVGVQAGVVVDATGLAGGFGDPGGSTVQADSYVGLGARLPEVGYPVRPGELRMAVARRGYVGMVRVEDGSLNVAAAVDPVALRESGPAAVVAEVLAESGAPALLAAPRWRGTPRLTRTRGRPGGVRLLRVGDAAGYVEPFTGEGMCWALAGGRAAGALAAEGASAWGRDVLEVWGAYHRGRLRRAQWLCCAVRAGLRKPHLVRAVVGVLSIAPGLAAPLVRAAAVAPGPLRALPS